MYTEASTPLRVLYCFAVLSAVWPYGMSGWVALTLGVTRPSAFFALLPGLFLLVGLWRIYRVIRYPETLASYTFDGVLRFMRVVGILGMIVGCAYLVARFGAGFLVRSLARGGDASSRSVIAYIIGVGFALSVGLASLGITLFEFTRLLGFERNCAIVEEV